MEKMYEDCSICGGIVEACQGPFHRGITRCMECGGGLGDSLNRQCVNCVDLPYREMRERNSGERIAYETELTDDD